MKTNLVGTTRFAPVKNLIYKVGKQCYRNETTRLLYDLATVGVTHIIGLPLIPNYRVGEVRQAILRTTKLEDAKQEETKTRMIEVTPWDLELSPWIPQDGISDQQKHDFALNLVKGGMHQDYAMQMFGFVPAAATLILAHMISAQEKLGPLTKLGVKMAAVYAAISLPTWVSYLALAQRTQKKLAANYLINQHNMTLPDQLVGKKLNSRPVVDFILAQIETPEEK